MLPEVLLWLGTWGLDPYEGSLKTSKKKLKGKALRIGLEPFLWTSPYKGAFPLDFPLVKGTLKGIHALEKP